jgi:protein TonB
MKPAMADRTILGSAAAHAAILVAVLSSSLLRGCLFPSKPRELVTYIALQDPSPSIVDLQMPPLPEPPKPEPPKPPEAKPPEPEPPKDIPEPPKDPPKPKPPKVEVSKVKVRRPDTPPPAQKTKPPSAEDLRKMLTSGRPVGPTGPVGPVSDMPDWYFALVRKAMYDAWEQPGGLSASAGLKVIVEVRVARDGTVLKRDVIRTSGHPLMDESVSRALQAVRQLPALPETFRGTTRDIQIAFELTGGMM